MIGGGDPFYLQQAAMTTKRYEIGCQLLLLTNRKSHTGCRLIPILMTLNGVIALNLSFSPNSIDLLGNYVTVVEDRPMMSVNIVSQF